MVNLFVEYLHQAVKVAIELWQFVFTDQIGKKGFKDRMEQQAESEWIEPAIGIDFEFVDRFELERVTEKIAEWACAGGLQAAGRDGACAVAGVEFVSRLGDQTIEHRQPGARTVALGRTAGGQVRIAGIHLRKRLIDLTAATEPRKPPLALIEHRAVADKTTCRRKGSLERLLIGFGIARLDPERREDDRTGKQLPVVGQIPAGVAKCKFAGQAADGPHQILYGLFDHFAATDERIAELLAFAIEQDRILNRAAREAAVVEANDIRVAATGMSPRTEVRYV